MQISLTVTALLMFGQAVLAGLFMGGAHSAFAWHREMATVTGIALMIAIVAAAVASRLGQAPRSLIAATVGLLAMMSLQAFAGFRSLPALHVPLGVIVILAAAALAIWAWRLQPAAERSVASHHSLEPMSPGR